jgi:hypothetical protein
MTTTRSFIGSSLLALGCLATVGATVASASAAGGTVVSGGKVTSGKAAPGYAALPVVELPEMPTLAQRPAQVSAQEKVDGIYTALPPDAQRNHGVKGLRYVSLFSSEDEAKAFRRAGFGPATPNKGAVRACFTTADKWRLQSDERDWMLGAEERPSIHGVAPRSEAVKQYPDAGVNAVRMERLVVDAGDAAKLEVTDAWIDPATTGVRLIGRATLPLVRVSEGPEGIAVYAARDASGKVHYVVRSPEEGDNSLAFRSRHKMMSRGSQMASSDCGHAHLVLRSTRGSGEQGAVRVELAMLDDAPKKPAATEPKAATDSPLKRLLFFGRGGEQPAEPDQQPREARIRTLVVYLSVSQLTDEPQPIASVSFGWQGRERRMQVF